MRKVRGRDYTTVADAARLLGISTSTLQRYIRAKHLPPPAREYFGMQSVAVFSAEYIEDARRRIEVLRARKL